MRSGRPYDGFRSDGKHEGFTEVENKVNLNNKVSAEMECSWQQEEGKRKMECVCAEGYKGVKLGLGTVGQMEIEKDMG